MPTGYTAQLEEHWDVARWLRQEVVRGLGLCVLFRDNDAMTDEQILEALKRETTDSYYAKALAKDQAELAEALTRSTEEWEKEREREISVTKKSMEQTNADIAAKAVKYNEAVAKVEDFHSRALSEGGKVVASFALSQLKLVASEYEPSSYLQDEVNKLEKLTVDEYKKNRIETLEHSVKFSRKQLAEAESRNKKRLEAYEGLLKDCQTLLSGSERSPVEQR